MTHRHDFPARVVWTGNIGQGNRNYRGYHRTWTLATAGKPEVHCSNDPLLGGDPTLHNPEDILIAALASCHMLWFLHLASNAGVIVEAYEDNAVGIGESEPSGKGRFVEAILKPRITVAPGTDTQKADEIHHDIHNHCFIARSVNFPVRYEPEYIEANS